MRNLKITTINVILPLIIGWLIYISFRSTTLKMFIWFKYIGFDSSILTIRQELSNLKLYLPPWTYYSLPDGLWVYSFTSALLILWDNKFKIAKFWLLIPLFSGVIIDVTQGLKIIRGTFDILDLTLSIVASLLSIITINYKFKKNDNQKQVH